MQEAGAILVTLVLAVIVGYLAIQGSVDSGVLVGAFGTALGWLFGLKLAAASNGGPKPP
jgi:hypothetical protein